MLCHNRSVIASHGADRSVGGVQALRVGIMPKQFAKSNSIFVAGDCFFVTSSQ